MKKEKIAKNTMRPVDKANMIQALKDEAGTTIALNHHKREKERAPKP